MTSSKKERREGKRWRGGWEGMEEEGREEKGEEERREGFDV